MRKYSKGAFELALLAGYNYNIGDFNCIYPHFEKQKIYLLQIPEYEIRLIEKWFIVEKIDSYILPASYF
jgi:hypothetical protein